MVPASRFELLECQAAKEAVADNAFDWEPHHIGTLDTLAQHVMGVACSEPFALDALHGEVTAPEGLRLAMSAATAAEAMNGQPLEKQRELFKAVSATLIALVDAMPPSSGVSGTLYVVNCPMAQADWLQRSKTIANPYYADDMKECGSVVRPVGGSKGAE